MGHLARLIEEAGIPTVIISTAVFLPRLTAQRPARLLLTRSLMGRPLGTPGDRLRQQNVLNAAIDLLTSATAGETIVEFDQA